MKHTFKVNKRRFESRESQITGQMILQIAGLIPEEDYELLYKINEKGYTPIQLDEKIDLRTAGIEGLRANLYHKICIKLNEEEIEVEDCFMTPFEIMAAGNVDPNEFSLTEIRKGNVEVSYKDDLDHKIAINRHSCFLTKEITKSIECVIVNAKLKEWSKTKIYFEDVVKLAYNQVSSNPNIIYTVNYIKGVPNKPEGSMVKGDKISVNNKMIFNVTRTDKS